MEPLLVPEMDIIAVGSDVDVSAQMTIKPSADRLQQPRGGSGLLLGGMLRVDPAKDMVIP